MKKSAKRIATPGAVAVLVATGLVGCSPAGSDGPDPAEYDSFDWKQHEGTELNLALVDYPWANEMRESFPEFEELTGIKLNAQVLPDDQHRQRLQIDLTSGTGEIDVLMGQVHQEGELFYRSGWYEPLQPYVDDPTRTNEDFDFADFSDAAINTGGTVQGELIGLPISTEMLIMFYRTDLFEQAGLEVPATLEELEVAVRTLDEADNGAYGICNRGQGAAATTILTGFLYSAGGGYLDADGKFVLNTPENVKGLEIYADLVRNYGPEGVVNYHWMQCEEDFASGRAAIWTDTNIFAGGLVDESQSTVADSVGVAQFPGERPAGGSWMLGISSNSSHKDAAWYFLQWALGKEKQLEAQLKGHPMSRESVWQNEEFIENDAFPALTAATEASLQSDLVMWNPPLVHVGEGRDALGAAIVEAIQGGDIEAALATAEARIHDIEPAP